MNCAYCGEKIPEKQENLTYEAGVGAVVWHEGCGGTVLAPENDDFQSGDKF